MSVVYCHTCDQYIDTDYDLEHFIDDEMELCENSDVSAIVERLLEVQDANYALRTKNRRLMGELVRFCEDYEADQTNIKESYQRFKEAIKKETT